MQGRACWEESEKFAHRFGVQLMSVLRQNLLHAGLVCVCYEPKPPEKKQTGRGEKEASLRMNKICLKSTLLVKHGVTGRRSEHASFLPRPFGNGIPHHHALLHLAEFTKVLLQALCKNGGGGIWLDDPGHQTPRPPASRPR